MTFRIDFDESKNEITFKMDFGGTDLIKAFKMADLHAVWGATGMTGGAQAQVLRETQIGKGNLGDRIGLHDSKPPLVLGRNTQFTLDYSHFTEPKIHAWAEVTEMGAAVSLGNAERLGWEKRQGVDYCNIAARFTLAPASMLNVPCISLSDAWQAGKAKSFLKDWVAGKGKLQIKAKWQQTESLSNDLSMLAPRILGQFLVRQPSGIEPRSGVLQWKAQVAHLEEPYFWVQLREYSNYTLNTVLKINGQAWVCIRAGDPKPSLPWEATLNIPFSQIAWPSSLGEGKYFEVFPVISALPDEAGIINQAFWPDAKTRKDRVWNIPVS